MKENLYKVLGSMNLSEENKVLISLSLNSDSEIGTFLKWLKENVSEEEIKSKENEIVGKAIEINENEFYRYKQHLLTMVNSINQELSLTKENQVLIVYKLNTVQKIRKFMDWIGQNLKNGKLNATEQEIVRIAVKIGKEN